MSCASILFVIEIYLAVSIGMLIHYIECLIQILTMFPNTRKLYKHLPKPMNECVYVGVLIYTLLLTILYKKVWFRYSFKKRILFSLLTANLCLTIIELMRMRTHELLTT
jgi:hypothetical protein